MSQQERVPSWPSLYNLGLEIIHIEHKHATQPGGSYLYNANGVWQFQSTLWPNLIELIFADIFHFTLYWTLVLYTPSFLLCGIYAFLNIVIRPSQRSFNGVSMKGNGQIESGTRSALPKTNERRSRATYALLILLTFLMLSVSGAVIGSAIGGYVLAGLFKAGKFNMSTCVLADTISCCTVLKWVCRWMPFLWVVVQVLIGLLG